MGYNDFGDFYYSHGALADAFKSYVRTRDYCTTAKHIIHMCMSAILVSIEMGQFTHVTSYVGRAEQSPDSLDLITVAKLRCAAGLAHLEAKKYKLAARKVCHMKTLISVLYFQLKKEKNKKEGKEKIYIYIFVSSLVYPVICIFKAFVDVLKVLL